MIAENKRELPDEWTDELCRELFDHARDLGQNGNPGGYILTINLFPFMGREDKTDHENVRRYAKPYDQWDYEGLRKWISEHQEDVRICWQRAVRPDWW